jgi:phage shock protein C
MLHGVPARESGAMTNSNAPFQNLSGKVLRRSANQRMLSGVSGGIADYLNVDVTLVRLGWVGLTLITGGAALIGYAVAWIVIPESDGKAVWQNVQQSVNQNQPQDTTENDIASRLYDDTNNKPPAA